MIAMSLFAVGAFGRKSFTVTHCHTYSYDYTECNSNRFGLYSRRGSHDAMYVSMALSLAGFVLQPLLVFFLICNLFYIYPKTVRTWAGYGILFCTAMSFFPFVTLADKKCHIRQHHRIRSCALSVGAYCSLISGAIWLATYFAMRLCVPTKMEGNDQGEDSAIADENRTVRSEVKFVRNSDGTFTRIRTVITTGTEVSIIESIPETAVALDHGQLDSLIRDHGGSGGIDIEHNKSSDTGKNAEDSSTASNSVARDVETGPVKTKAPAQDVYFLMERDS